MKLVSTVFAGEGTKMTRLEILILSLSTWLNNSTGGKTKEENNTPVVASRDSLWKRN